jgi:hypothetical protein
MKFIGPAVLLFSIAAAPAFAQSAFTIPPEAQNSGDLSASSKWTWSHDSGTPGSAVGSTQFPVGSPSLDGKAREFYMSYSDKGGERFSVTFDHNTEVTHFVYDTYVYIDDPSQLANLEMDMNQVMSDGKTVIYAFQCSSYSKSWEYSTIEGNSPHWHSTGLACSPKNWAANTWHHIQIASHRNSSGDVTYDWVGLDGNNKVLKNATGPGALALHWGIGDLNLNFQLDGAESRGDVKLYQDKLTIFYW